MEYGNMECVLDFFLLLLLNFIHLYRHYNTHNLLVTFPDAFTF